MQRPEVRAKLKTGVKVHHSADTRARISASVKKTLREKRIAQGLPADPPKRVLKGRKKRLEPASTTGAAEGDARAADNNEGKTSVVAKPRKREVGPAAACFLLCCVWPFGAFAKPA